MNNKMTIRAKLYLCFLLIAMIIVFMGTYSVINIKKINRSRAMYQTVVGSLGDVTRFNNDFQKIRSYYRDILIDSTKTGELLFEINDHLAKTDSDYLAYGKTMSSAEEQLIYAKWTDTYGQFKKDINEYLNMVSSGKYSKAYEFQGTGDLSISSNKLVDIVDQLIIGNIKTGEKLSKAEETLTTATISVTILVLV
ncbi:MAG: hypothetical protein GYA51_09140, partial [Candidatus Methanofastidiosa archaeon]|nr:hypothetical protein [Candidatus Methanofastidiosa archaeon]